MAREFSTSEIIRQKCSICGSKNKKFTELLYDGKFIGYQLTCCNCFHTDKFVSDEDHTNCIHERGHEVCIQVSPCKHKTCPYYGKYTLKDAAKMIDNILSGKDINDGLNNGENNNSNNNGCNNSDFFINFLNSDKLDINGYDIDKPKFH